MLKFKKEGAELYIPDNADFETALKRTTVMSIAAHHDDIEIMSCHGIIECFGRDDQWFFGVVATDGAGSPRNGIYKNYSDEDMKKIRKKEQKKSAYIGEYSAVCMLNYKSSEIKDPNNQEPVMELAELIRLAKPRVIYTHNFADKHDTHVGTAVKVIKAIRSLPCYIRPGKVYGCEVWRGLDWMLDSEKIVLDVSGHENIGNAVLAVHDSQICGGKRYDLATQGRRLANATYAESHNVDQIGAATYAMDLTPLIEDDSLDIVEYVTGFISRFYDDVKGRINKML
ncbi:MAG: PIG-L family deacetylase [Clostridiaceae bacterium]|nr:PIG-L family deacetylase [Clostridiaceae bacterium]